ncbi:MAG: hypothetical protein JSS53_00970 [Proteobacteria bacterium]|nr:hypothetical protein [Pseudomonadota bacterium]
MSIIKQQIKIGPSKIFSTLLVLIHFAAINSIWMTTFSLFPKLFLSMICFINLLISINQYALRKMHNSITEIREGAKRGEWHLIQRDGTAYCCIIHPPILVTLKLIAVKFKDLKTGRYLSVVIFSDAVSKEEMRRLRYCFRNA